MDTGKKHTNTTIHDNIRGIETCTLIYMVLFICNYECDTDQLERALSSLIEIIFSGGFSFYQKYEVIELLYLSRQSSSTNIMSTNILVMFLISVIIRYTVYSPRDMDWDNNALLLFIYLVGGKMLYSVNVYFIQTCKYRLNLSMWLILKRLKS